MPAGSSMTLVPEAAPGSRFVGWQDSPCGAQPSCTVTATSNVLLVTRFAPAGHAELIVRQPGDGNGTVTADPPGAECGDGCHDYRLGTAVTLRVRPLAQNAFTGWSGVGSRGRARRCRLTVDADTTVAATLQRRAPSLHVEPTALHFAGPAVQRVQLVNEGSRA